VHDAPRKVGDPVSAPAVPAKAAAVGGPGPARPRDPAVKYDASGDVDDPAPDNPKPAPEKPKAAPMDVSGILAPFFQASVAPEKPIPAPMKPVPAVPAVAKKRSWGSFLKIALLVVVAAGALSAASLGGFFVAAVALLFAWKIFKNAGQPR